MTMEKMLLHIFQQQVLLQCKFVLLANYDIKASLVTADITRTFYAIQSLLNAAANISKTLWGQGRSQTEERKPLRESIDVSNDSPLRRILIRNDFEHFDERLTRWWEESASHNCIDLNIGPVRTATKGFSEIDTFRNFNPASGEVMFWGTDFNINSIISEVIRILPKLEEATNKPHWV